MQACSLSPSLFSSSLATNNLLRSRHREAEHVHGGGCEIRRLEPGLSRRAATGLYLSYTHDLRHLQALYLTQLYDCTTVYRRTQRVTGMAYRPLTPYRGDRSTAAVDDEAYEMNVTRSTTHNTLHVADTLYHPLVSSENIRPGDHPMATATDEIYETNATQLASHKTVRRVEDYRPLASSDDIRFGVSSHNGANGPHVTRDSISSAPRQQETAEEIYLTSSALRRSSENMKRGNALERFTSAYNRGALDSWFYECAALAFSVGCLVALGVMLLLYDGKETPQLPYNITLNALISVLSTAAKSSLLFAVGGTLGQTKWAWFTESRELSDMQTFDDATRGPWGALILLCSRSIRPLASLGAAITILALAYGPFLQQLVRYPVVQVRVATTQATTKKATTLDATGNFSNWNSARGAAWSDIRQFDLNPDCPTGNCTWPPFTSLGYCSKCGDTTAETSVDCRPIVQSWAGDSNVTCEIHPSQGYPASVWQGISTNSTGHTIMATSLRSIVWIVRETSGRESNPASMDPARAFDPEPDSAFQSVTGSQHDYLGIANPMLVFTYAHFDQEESWDSVLIPMTTPLLAKAETCVMTPCERTYQLSMTAGQLDTVVAATDYGVSEILVWPRDSEQVLDASPFSPRQDRCWRTTSYRGTNASDTSVEHCIVDGLNRGLAVTGCYEGDPTSGHIFCTPEGVDSSAEVTNSIGLLGREGQTHFLSGGSDETEERRSFREMGFPMEADMSQAIQDHNFSYLMKRIAASMTKAELDNSVTLVYGDMSTSAVHVEVVWYWFILPATLNVLAILLLLATAVLSHRHKTRLWKSSALALLYHGLDDPEPAPNLTMAKVSEMERWAAATSATLGSTKDGGRVVLKTVQRVHASNGLDGKTDGV